MVGAKGLCGCITELMPAAKKGTRSVDAFCSNSRSSTLPAADGQAQQQALCGLHRLD